MQQITFQTKVKICGYYALHSATTHEQLGEKFGIANRKTVTGILRESDKWIKATREAKAAGSSNQQKKLRECDFPQV